MEDFLYWKILRLLLYLSTRTRPDLVTALFILGNILIRPGTEAFEIRCAVFLRHSQQQYFLFKLVRDTQPDAWCDADWARLEGKTGSRIGYILYFNCTAVLWVSKLQISDVFSTCKAEFTALRAVIRHISLMKNVQFRSWMRAEVSNSDGSRKA